MAIVFNVTNGKIKKYYALKELLTIGRSSQNDIVIETAQASSFHGQFYLSTGTIFYKDLGSKNGSLVNGEKVSICRFYFEDKLSIEEFIITIDKKHLTKEEQKRLARFPSID